MKAIDFPTEHERMASDLMAHVKIVGEQAKEIERLRAALEQATAELSEIKTDATAAWDAACSALNNQQKSDPPSAWELLAKRLYISDCDNHPTINKFPAWEELAETQRAEWRKRAARQHQIS